MELEAASIDPEILQRWEAHCDQGRNANSRAQMAEAEEHFLKALSLAEQTPLGDHYVMRSLSNLAGYYANRNRKRDARRVATSLLGMQERLLGPDHPDLVGTLGLLAELDPVMHSNEQTEAWHRRALDIAERYWGKESPEIVMSLRGLALSQIYRDVIEAETLWLRAIAILEAHADTDEWCSSYLPAAVSCLSLTYMMNDQHEKLEQSTKREIELAITRGDDDLTVGAMVRKLATACAAQGKLEEADSYFSAALMQMDRWYTSAINARRSRRHLGESPSRFFHQARASELGSIRMEQSEVKECLGDHDGAVSLRRRARRDFRRALRFCEKEGKEDDLRYDSLLHELANVCRKLGLLREAVEYDERNLRIYEQMAAEELAEYQLSDKASLRAGFRDRFRETMSNLIRRYTESLSALGRDGEANMVQDRYRAIVEGNWDG